MNRDENYLCRYVLITNLRTVVIGNVEMHAYALLLEDHPATFGDGPDRRIRGFGTDPAWPVFCVRGIPSIEFELVDASGGPIMITDSKPEGRPLFSGAIMQIADGGPRLDLILSDHERAFDVQRFEGRSANSPITKVWAKLPGLVAKFWDAPNMPGLTWGPSPGYRHRR